MATCVTLDLLIALMIGSMVMGAGILSLILGRFEK